jgi:PAS domain S-box-containing protein
MNRIHTPCFEVIIDTKSFLIYFYKMKKHEEISKAKSPDASKKQKKGESPREATLETLHQSEERYRAILENMQEGYFEVDLTGNFTLCNDSLCRIHKRSKDEIMRMNNRQYMDKETQKKVFKAFNSVYKTGEPLPEIDWQIIRKDGVTRYIEASVSLLKDSSGKPIGFRGITRDVTERKKAEESISKSERKYSSTFHLIPNPMAVTEMATGKIVDVNKTFINWTGYSREELIGFSTQDIHLWVNPEDREKIIGALTATGEVNGTELVMRQKNGDIRNVLFSARFIEIDQERYLLTLAQDITERKQTEYELLASESNFHHSLDDSPLGVRISTVEGETIYANRAILDMYGYDSIEELKNMSVKERYTPESYAEFQIRKAKRLRGEFGPSEYEISIVRKNGEIRNLYVFRKEIFWNGTKQSQVIYQDITDRSQAEEKLKEILESLRKAIKTTIQVLGTATEARDPYTAGHQKRVTDLARVIATEMGLPLDTIEGIRMAGSIHDIGKISIPAEILSKPAKLTEIEFSLIKVHVQNGYEMLKDVESSWPLAEIVYQHHERMNGSGYPRSLKGDEIILEARIMAVADVVEAMASHRPYRAALGIEAALKEIENNNGILYDNAVVDACLKLFREKGYQFE